MKEMKRYRFNVHIKIVFKK